MQNKIHEHLDNFIQEEITKQISNSKNSDLSTKNQLSEISKEDVTSLFSGFAGSATEVVKEYVVAQVLEALGVDSETFLGKLIVQGFGELTVAEIKDFLDNPDYATCEKFTRGALRVSAATIVDAVVNEILVSLDIRPEKFSPGKAKATTANFGQMIIDTFKTGIEDALQDALVDGDLGYAIADGICQIEWSEIRNSVKQRFKGIM